ncbi:MAG TPA: DUF86 domain-containing protein [Spirochaetota bacterium]|nr:DUF86 domain-containing protein [Spirochaetota bacterium]HQP48729.1 DUF86 domain-containing protein [Spirochaetota bacterium]
MRDYRLYIEDIEESILKIMSYTEDYDEKKFAEDSRTFESVILNLFIIGEAANKIPESIQCKYPDIDWRAIIGMRNIIAHGYFKIKSDIIWKTIQDDLPVLLDLVKKIR